MSNSLLLWLGEERPPVKVNRKRDLVMDSVINYYNARSPELPYKPGQLFLDSGAYTARRKGISLEPEKVAQVQESIDPDKVIPLDYPLTPGMTEVDMRKSWRKTTENIIYWQEHTSLHSRVVPALHAWSKRSLLDNVRWLRKYADSDYVAIGSVVANKFDEPRDFFGDRHPRPEIIDMISLAMRIVKECTDFKTHLMGFGSSPLMLHIGYYLGADSTDSAGYRRKAAYGKIILPGTGERHIGSLSASFGATNLNSRDWKLLEKCGCPICKNGEYELLWKDWQARATHNEYIMKKETALAQELLAIGLEAYEKYLDRIFIRSSLNYLWRFAKFRLKYRRISDILF